MSARIVLALLMMFRGAAHAAEKHSGIDDAGPETRAMQADDTINPAFLWVQEGETLWQERTGTADRSCVDCHGAAPTSMHGVAARYPAYDTRRAGPVTLAQRINTCRTEHQGAAALAPESDGLLSLSAYVGLQSRGLKMSVAADGPMRPFYEAGERLFKTREGQLNLSCQQCHDQLAGQKLAGSVIPQGHPNAYPLYRLEWQSLGSLYRRLRNCMVGVRAKPFAPDAPELVALEVYLGVRASGLAIETPGVRP